MSTSQEQRGWGVVVGSIFFATLTIVVVVMRLFARFVILKSPDIDDYLVAVGAIPLVGLNVCLALASKVFNFDKKTEDIPVDDIARSRKILLPILLCYILSMCCTRLAVLFLYRRVTTSSVTRTLKQFSWLMISFVLAFTLSFVIVLFLICQPLNAYWNKEDPRWLASRTPDNWTCLDDKAIFVSNAAIGAIQDFITCSVPLFILRRLHLSLKQKLWLSLIFLVGYGTCIISATRIYFIYQVWYQDDYQWNANNAFLFTVLETNMAAICVSLPCSRLCIQACRGDRNPAKKAHENLVRWPRVDVRNDTYDGLSETGPASRSNSQYSIRAALAVRS